MPIVTKFTRINSVGPVHRPRVPREANPRANEVFVTGGEGRQVGRSRKEEKQKLMVVYVLLRS